MNSMYSSSSSQLSTSSGVQDNDELQEHKQRLNAALYSHKDIKIKMLEDRIRTQQWQIEHLRMDVTSYRLVLHDAAKFCHSVYQNRNESNGGCSVHWRREAVRIYRVVRNVLRFGNTSTDRGTASTAEVAAAEVATADAAAVN